MDQIVLLKIIRYMRTKGRASVVAGLRLCTRGAQKLPQEDDFEL